MSIVVYYEIRYVNQIQLYSRTRTKIIDNNAVCEISYNSCISITKFLDISIDLIACIPCKTYFLRNLYLQLKLLYILTMKDKFKLIKEMDLY